MWLDVGQVWTLQTLKPPFWLWHLHSHESVNSFCFHISPKVPFSSYRHHIKFLYWCWLCNI